MFTENRAPLLNFEQSWQLELGALFLPLVGSFAHLFSGNIFDWELTNPFADDLYPG